jgi:hypothetical protein
LYTGRGPVCGMITRGAGGTGAAGRTGAGGGATSTGAAGVTGAAELVAAGSVGGGGATFGGTTTTGGIALAAGAGGATGGGATGLGGIKTGAGGRAAATDAGVTNLGAGGSATGAGGGVVVTAAGGATGAADAAGRAIAGGAAAGAGFASGRAGGWATASFCCVIARSTSPGREICERSILVLISSPSRVAREDFVEVPDSSPRARRCLRTSSASCSSRELECVFFSVTPTIGSVSRIALLLTSSSRARSLIRILLIRSRFPFRSVPLRSHVNLTDSV